MILEVFHQIKRIGLYPVSYKQLGLLSFILGILFWGFGQAKAQKSL
jgi:hypothetical protein